MNALLLVWLMIAVALVALVVRSPREGGALMLAYFLALSLIHVPGALAYMDLAYAPLSDDDTVLGFEATLIGMGAYLCGALLEKWVGRRATSEGASTIDLPKLEGMSRRFVLLGLLVFFFVLPLAAIIPTLTSIVAPLAGLLVVGIWLALYGAAVARNFHRLLAIMLMLLTLPLATLAIGGFIGVGLHWIMTAVTFLIVVVRRRFWLFAVSPLVVYLGLSFFVAYTGERVAIRETIWQQHAGLIDRLDRIGDIIRNFELLDLRDPVHNAALDSRLNQNILVGRAVERHQAGYYELALGSTVPWWAFMPRALWANKPEIGGGGDLVAEYTGMTFGAGTSVGAGQVLEFYVNFGWLGVIAGFIGYGFLLMRLDRGLMRELALGNVPGIVFRALPGLALINAGNNLVEVFVGVVASLVTAYLVVLLERRRLARLAKISNIHANSTA